MTVLKQYNAGTSTWETVVVGQPGEAGIVNGTVAPADTSVLWLDTADTASQVAIPSGGTTGQILAKTSNTEYATGWTNPSPVNMIINGGMDIWQRGTSSFTGWTADRWFSDIPGIISRSTDVPAGTGLSYSLKHTGATANAALRQGVELPGTGNQGVFFDGSQWTASFWVKLSAGTRNIGMYLAFTTGAGAVAREIFLDTSTNIATTSWQKVSYTFAIPTGNSVSSAVCVQVTPFIVGSGSSVDVFMTGVQLESGSIATAFKRNANSLQGELAACQRYYVRFKTVDDYAPYMHGFIYNSTTSILMAHLPVTMRAQPTAVEWAAQEIFDFNQTRLSVSNITMDRQSAGIAQIAVTHSSGSAGRGCWIRNAANNTGYIGFWAEIY